MMEKFRGTGVAIVTPFKEDKSIDFEALTKLVEHLISGGVDYLVVLGTTGETATLSLSEQKAVLAHVKQVNASRLPLVLGIGGNNTAEVLSRYGAFDLNEVSAILTASPYYNKPTQEGIYQHYKALAEQSPLPIILYNVPGRTALNMTAETTVRLAKDFENIIGIKEASADMDQVMQILKHKPDRFFLTSGEDALTFPMVAIGGVGVISVVANALPKTFSDMVRAALNHDLSTASELHYKVLDFIYLLFEEGNPGGIKSALNHLGICHEHMRQPLWPISETLSQKIRKELNI